MTPRTLLALLVGLVFGTLFGALLVSSDSVERAGPAALDVRAAPPSVADPIEAVESDLASARRSVPEMSLRPQALVPTTAVRDVASRAATPALSGARGNDLTYGTVRDLHGNPIAGATIAARIEFNGNTGSFGQSSATPPWVLRSIEDVLLETAERWAQRRSETIVATTGADGRFRIEGLADEVVEVGSYLNLEFFHPDYVLRSPLWSVRPNVELEIVARRLVPVTFDLRNARGGVLDRAWLFLELTDGNGVDQRIEWTAEERTFMVVEGDTSVFAATAAAPRYWSHEQAKTSALGTSKIALLQVQAGMAPVVLVVEESDALIVSPKFSGPRIEGFQVRLELRSTTVDRASRGPLRSESIHASTKEIVFAELEPGAYVLRLDRPSGGEPLAELEVTFDGGAQRLEFVIPPLEVCDSRRFRVMSADGLPVEHCTFARSYRSDQGRLVGRRVQAAWRGVGWYDVSFERRYSLQGESPEALPNGAVGPQLLTVEHRDHGRIEVPYDSLVGDAELRFPALARATVFLPLAWANGDDEPVVRVRATDPSAPQQSSVDWSEVTVTADGRCVLPELFPGEYSLWVTIAREQVHSAPVTLTSGESLIVVEPEPK
ncbi:hypothetical protein Pla163_17970 [Planctomycetes bacterium Pla163]|uniref:Uncharacterized protein n=1 Tax=Rohdeia mirabilis TaxID=2528008 RepID=A0A518CZR2_9BACT|nr:hypothetical protein Pla163_17970 [Planctomycetes bacterium Pla163]